MNEYASWNLTKEKLPPMENETDFERSQSGEFTVMQKNLSSQIKGSKIGIIQFKSQKNQIQKSA